MVKNTKDIKITGLSDTVVTQLAGEIFTLANAGKIKITFVITTEIPVVM